MKNREQNLIKAKEYRINNYEKVKELARQRRIRRNTEDPIYVLRMRLRSITHDAFYKNYYSNKSQAYKILGCDYDTFIRHLKQTYFENYGEEYIGQDVDLDHIYPLCMAKTEEDVYRLSNYKNLQLLKPEDNRKKRN